MNDRVIDVSSARELAHGLNCPLQLYDQYSHAVFDEAPEVKQRVLNFLRQE
ncbi:MAG: hypothetical protein MJ136_00750 [Clostridia bacterium]|nr:hypothetical protein [Clostridia bacterium]